MTKGTVSPNRSDPPESPSGPDVDLAALLCSRLCHDIISPLGAIANGLEMLEEKEDEETRDMAMALIRKSTDRALTILQFARLAFGAGSSAGQSIRLDRIRTLVEPLIKPGRITLDWQAIAHNSTDKTIDGSSIDKNYAKLLLNIIPLVGVTIPRGGEITITLTGDESRPDIRLDARGPDARLPDNIITPMSSETPQIDTRNIQAVLSVALAHKLGRQLKWDQHSDSVTLHVL
ncbi:MAG: histidine phosphotransferase family protein [Parvularculales bacterium]